MTRVEMTGKTLFAIAGSTSLTARQLAGKHMLKKNLYYDNSSLAGLANRMSDILKVAGTKRWIPMTTLRADAVKVSDCVALMMKKGFSFEPTADQVAELIKAAKEAL